MFDRNAYMQAYNKKPEAMEYRREVMRKYRKTDKGQEYYKMYNFAYYQDPKKKEELHKRNLEYYKNHKQDVLNRITDYRKNNKEKIYMKNKIYTNANKDKVSTWRQKGTMKLKILILSKYSGGQPICKNCGITDIRVLSIDHINGGGSRHRKEISNTYQWLKKNNFPEGFQVLCMNCQYIKRYENHEVVGRNNRKNKI